MSRSEYVANLALRTGVDHGRNWNHARPLPYRPRRKHGSAVITTLVTGFAVAFCVAVLAALIILPAIGA